jgi:hypothetical protein
MELKIDVAGGGASDVGMLSTLLTPQCRIISTTDGSAAGLACVIYVSR